MVSGGVLSGSRWRKRERYRGGSLQLGVESRLPSCSEKGRWERACDANTHFYYDVVSVVSAPGFLLPGYCVAALSAFGCVIFLPVGVCTTPPSPCLQSLTSVNVLKRGANGGSRLKV